MDTSYSLSLYLTCSFMGDGKVVEQSPIHFYNSACDVLLWVNIWPYDIMKDSVEPDKQSIVMATIPESIFLMLPSFKPSKKIYIYICLHILLLRREQINSCPTFSARMNLWLYNHWKMTDKVHAHYSNLT